MATRKTPVKRSTSAPAKPAAAPAARPRSAPPRKRAVKSLDRATTGAPPGAVAVVAPEARYHWIAQAAYLRAEKRGFAPGHEVDDWLAAEADFAAAHPAAAD